MAYRSSVVIALALAAWLVAPLSLHAHRGWLLPSSTVVSGQGAWVTVDAAVSNDLFFFDHQPLRLDNLVVTAPDGSIAKTQNASTGRYRSTFDVRLEQAGTYRIASASDRVVASYQEAGALKHWQGAWAELAQAVPANATELAVQRTTSRVEIFVTSGKPSAVKPTGIGLELVPVTHPNDVVAGEAATFTLVLDGKPAAGLDLTAIPGGVRYRDSVNEKHYKTGEDGRVVIAFDEPGMYWISASYQEGGQARRQGGGPRAGGPAAGPGPGAGAPPAVGRGRGPRLPEGPVTPGRRASYAATLEVLPQ